MKTALLAGVFVYATLVVLTTFIPWEEARIQASAAGFTEEEISNGLEYARQRSLLRWSYAGAHYSFYIAILLSGIARKLADCIHARTGRWFLTVLGMILLFLTADFFLALPFGVVGLEMQRGWGLSDRPWEEWLGDRCVGFAVHALTWGAVLGGLYLLLRFSPRRWWLIGTALGLIGGVAYAFLQPLLIAPLFNTFTPLRDTKWKDLEPVVRNLAARAGIEVEEILVMDASRQSRHSNAYFAGFGPSRRIVLYDNLLEAHRPAEVETVLGHEIGHWQHDHIVKGIVLAVPALLAALFALSWILRRAVARRPLSLNGPDDPAGVPLVMFLFSLGMFLAAPVENAVSRHFERQADRAALDLSRNPDAFIEAERNLARKNISNVAPAPWNVWLFASHPTTIEALQMAEEWRRQQQGKK